MRKSYIGVTGGTTIEVANSLLGVMPVESNRLLMIGVLVSSKTAKGLQNKRPNRYQKIECVKGIFPSHSKALNLIHYHTKEPETLKDQLVTLVKSGGSRLHGFQLNVAWPPPGPLREFRMEYPFVQMVLQIGNRAFELIEHSPQRLARKVATEYSDFVDYILLDPSGGEGKAMDTEIARSYLEALGAKDMDIGLGVAGGLSPATLHLAEPLLKDFPELSIDAEGGLRDGEDRLNVPLTQEYIRGALKMFSR